VALVYLAPALRRFPELGRRYVECLLSVPVETRGSLLEASETDSLSLTDEGALVIGCNTQRYRLSGVPLLWDQELVTEHLVEIIQES
jgi:hypothetical protein